MRFAIGLIAAVVALSGAVWWLGSWVSDGQERQRRDEIKERREGPCKDESMLLATTSGSPSYFACPNRLHEMQVQVATHPSNEEAAALVFCKCRREP